MPAQRTHPVASSACQRVLEICFCIIIPARGGGLCPRGPPAPQWVAPASLARRRGVLGGSRLSHPACTKPLEVNGRWPESARGLLTAGKRFWDSALGV
eukprot:3559280-Alexandrium_andersonii.AAC.1